MKTELKKITIEVGGKKMDFTPEEAKELKNILAELFGADKVIERTVHVNWWHRPYYTWNTSLPQYGTFTGGTGVSAGQAWSGSYNAGNVTLTAGGATA